MIFTSREMIQFDDHIFQMGWLETAHLDSAFDPFDWFFRWGVAVDKDGGIFVSDERRGIVPRQPNLSEDPQRKGPFLKRNESSQQVPRIFRGYVAVLEGVKCHGWFERFLVSSP